MAELRVNVDKDNSWRPGSEVCRLGVPMTGTSDYTKILSNITKQSISAVLSEYSHEALVTIANQWARKHNPVLCNKPVLYKAINGFRDLLATAVTKLGEWPTMVIAWKLPAHWSGFFYRSDPSAPFELKSHHIVLNGPCLELYFQDLQANTPESKVRWLEIFANYCHLIVHMFVAYMDVTYGSAARNTPAYRSSRQSCELKELGEIWEKYYFGGILVPGLDTSRSDYSSITVGIPTLIVEGKYCRVPFSEFLEFADRASNYVSGRRLMTPCPFDRPGAEPRWCEEFKEKFGRTFARARAHAISDCLPRSLADTIRSVGSDRLPQLPLPFTVPDGSNREGSPCCPKLMYFHDIRQRRILVSARTAPARMAPAGTSRDAAQSRGQTAAAAPRLARRARATRPSSAPSQRPQQRSGSPAQQSSSSVDRGVAQLSLSRGPGRPRR